MLLFSAVELDSLLIEEQLMVKILIIMIDWLIDL